MILADKIITLRKKNGWSQEELAAQLGVTRQSVSKWEGAQSIPDLEKILSMSKLFGVSTDYLLRDELEEAEYTPTDAAPDDETVRRVTMEEANTFLQVKAQTAKTISLATFLAILSPIPLMMLGTASEVPAYGISESFALAVGMVVLLLMVAGAVAMFLYSGGKTEPYRFLDTEVFETEYGVTGMVREKQKQLHDRRTRMLITATGLCILSIIPLFVSFLYQNNAMLVIGMVCLMMAIAGVGVMLFIRSEIPWESMKKLLQEGDYSRKQKQHNANEERISTAYWLVATAVYLGWSLPTNQWDRTWIVWVVAGLGYPALISLMKWNASRKEK